MASTRVDGAKVTDGADGQLLELGRRRTGATTVPSIRPAQGTIVDPAVAGCTVPAMDWSPELLLVEADTGPIPGQ